MFTTVRLVTNPPHTTIKKRLIKEQTHYM